VEYIFQNFKNMVKFVISCAYLKPGDVISIANFTLFHSAQALHWYIRPCEAYADFVILDN
jgi:hypothetical protein